MLTIVPSCALGAAALLLLMAPAGTPAPAAEPISPVVSAEDDNEKPRKYSSAKEAFQVGAAFYNARNYRASREPFEAALRLAKDDPELTLKINQALLASYRLIPEFEPFRDAAEFVIRNHHHDATRSITRRSFLSFSYQRGQMENLVKRYEKQLKKDPDNWLAVYLLSEIYSNGSGLPESVEHSKRAIALLQHLTKLDAERRHAAGSKPRELSPAESAKMAREKGKLARQFMQARQYKEAAELYEQIAELDPSTQAWNLKEAAAAWLKIDDRENALRLALAADQASPEARNDQLAHFFHRNLGDTYMALDQPAKAVPHYEIAVEKTTIEGYVRDTKASLQEAIEKSK
ncbi:MAG: hypothetical protein RIK87_17030 [Fuerstiella sp.]